MAQRRSRLLTRTSAAGDSMPNAHYDTMVKRPVETRERMLSDHRCNNSTRSLKKVWCIAVLYLTIVLPAVRGIMSPMVQATDNSSLLDRIIEWSDGQTRMSYDFAGNSLKIESSVDYL